MVMTLFGARAGSATAGGLGETPEELVNLFKWNIQCRISNNKQIDIQQQRGMMFNSPFSAVFRCPGEEVAEYSLYENYAELSEQSEQPESVSSNFDIDLSNHSSMTTQTGPQNLKSQPKNVYVQSSLHNCPKHLIGFVVQALELRQLQDLDQNQFLNSAPESLRMHLRGLLKIIILSHRGLIKSMSRELLKIVFETKSETISKLRLLENSYIREVFGGANVADMAEAKAYLRQQTIEMLALKKKRLLADSRIYNKRVNRRYLELFIRQLAEDRIRERITKQEKIHIAGIAAKKV